MVFSDSDVNGTVLKPDHRPSVGFTDKSLRPVPLNNSSVVYIRYFMG